MLLSLISLTLLGVIVGLVALYKQCASVVFLAVSYLMIVYIMGWEYVGQHCVKYEEVEHIYDYDFQKTNDFHVVLYIPTEHITYVRDEAEFYSGVSTKTKPLLVRTRYYNMYDDVIKESLKLVPLLPDVIVNPTIKTDSSATLHKLVIKKKARHSKRIKKQAVVLSWTPISIDYPYQLIDNGMIKHTRLVARGAVKLFLRNKIEQCVLLSGKGEMYVVYHRKNTYTAGKFKDSYDIKEEIVADYPVTISNEVAAEIFSH